MISGWRIKKILESLFKQKFKICVNTFYILYKWALFIKKFLRSSRPEVFSGKGVPKIYSKFTGEYLCRSVISKKLSSNLIEITLQHGRSPVNLLHIFRKPFLKNTYGRLLLNQYLQSWILNKILRPRFEINLNLRQLYTTNKRWQNFNKFKLSVFLLLDWTTWMWLT